MSQTQTPIYCFYIFDRHTECIYYRSWLPPHLSANAPPNLAANMPGSTQMNGASAGALPSSSSNMAVTPSYYGGGPTIGVSAATPITATTVTGGGATSLPGDSGGGRWGGKAQDNSASGRITSSSDNAKLVFGTVFSLRNMVRKLGGEDDAFVSYRTAEYKLHYYETPSSLRMVMLTDVAMTSMRNVLHQIYINLWVEYVVKNPLSPAEHKGGAGVNNELFEMGLDQFVRSLVQYNAQ